MGALQAKQRVLVVDDEPQMLLALEDLLGEDYSVLTATSAQRALELLERESDIAVVITDQRMPRMSGDELLAAMHTGSDVQTIMLTGYADLTAVTRAVNTGKLFAYVTKPWNGQDLIDKVERAAHQYRLSRSLTSERQLLRDLLDHSPDGIFFKDRDLRFVEVNRAYWTMLGLHDRSELLGKRVEDILDDAALRACIEREELGVMHSRKAALDSIRAYGDTDAEGRWLSETRAPICSEDRTVVVGLIGIARDVTDRVKTQTALSVSEELLRKQTGMLHAILEGLAEGVVVADAQGNFLLCNPEAERILGVDANALSVANWTAVCPMFDTGDTPISPAGDPLGRAIAGVTLTEREVSLCSKDGARTRVNISATPLRDPQGEIVGGIALLCDVTEQRGIERRLVQAQKMDAIGRLAGGVAHDFNNLLSVIQSCGELLLRALSPRDPKRAELGQILNASERAALLTRQLLSFSRQQVVQPKTLQLNDIVRKTDGMLRRVIGEHIEIVTRLDPELGYVSIDANQLEQIILNLAVNARDAMPEGGELHIETRNVSISDGGESGLPSGEYVVLAMRDTGTQRNVFEPLLTTHDAASGIGIGLSTVNGIVEQNTGHLRFRTAADGGTAFEIYLKRVDDHAARTTDAKRSVAPGAILLVEDEDNVRRIAAAILRRHGHTVLEARRPSDAVKLCAGAGQSIGLLLTEVVMPEITGPQLAAELRARHPSMNVLYLSGYSTNDALMGTNTRDGITFLQKPFTPALLIEAVSEAMAKQLH